MSEDGSQMEDGLTEGVKSNPAEPTQSVEVIDETTEEEGGGGSGEGGGGGGGGGGEDKTNDDGVAGEDKEDDSEERVEEGDVGGGGGGVGGGGGGGGGVEGEKDGDRDKKEVLGESSNPKDGDMVHSRETERGINEKEQKGGGRLEGEGEEKESDLNNKDKMTYKDQLLKSAGIQLEGSSDQDNDGTPADRNLEQFSEILLDSDLSPTDSEVGLSIPDAEGEKEEKEKEKEGGEKEEEEVAGKSKPERRVRFADEVIDTSGSQSSSRPDSLPTAPPPPSSPSRPSGNIVTPFSPRLQSPRSPSAPHTHEEIIAGVSYSAEYMGSTPIILTGNASAKTARMQQAQQVVKLFKDPENDVLPRFPVTIKISSQCIKIVDSTAGVDLMDHPLYTIAYVADVENVLVVMINRVPPPSAGDSADKRVNVENDEQSEANEAMKKEEEEKEKEEELTEGEEEAVRTQEDEGGGGEGEGGGKGGKEIEGGREAENKEEAKEDSGDSVEKTGSQVTAEEEEGSGEGEMTGLNIGPIPRMTCHVLETNDARHVAMVIGQAFSVAYKEFLRATGISEEALEQAEYAHILNAQTAPQAELDLLRDTDKIRKLNFAKRKGDILGVMVMESGYGSALPTPVIAHLSKTGSAVRSGQLNVGDHIITVNGVNMVGMPVKACIEQLKKCRYQNLVKMTVVSVPTVVDVTIVRPDLKFQLGFTIQDGVVRSLTRGSIAERSGVRVGHYIIEINGTSTVGLSHKDLVHLLTTTVGDLHLKTMPLLMYKLITGQVIPLYH